jgi:hypothetical protein
MRGVWCLTPLLPSLLSVLSPVRASLQPQLSRRTLQHQDASCSRTPGTQSCTLAGGSGSALGTCHALAAAPHQAPRMSCALARSRHLPGRVLCCPEPMEVRCAVLYGSVCHRLAAEVHCKCSATLSQKVMCIMMQSPNRSDDCCRVTPIAAEERPGLLPAWWWPQNCLDCWS